MAASAEEPPAPRDHDDDDEYRKVLAVIESIRKRTKHASSFKLQLPQIAVIGDQSSGKSSVLTELSGVPFPAKSGITTKRPVIVYTRHDASVQSTRFFLEKSADEDLIESEGDGTVDLGDANAETLEELLIVDADDEESSQAVSRDELEKTILAEQDAWLREHNCMVDSTPLVIRAVGPDCEDLVLVDLPGIIANGEESDKAQVLDMIKEHISPPETLILVVTEAKQDDETAHALQLARECDPEESRTLRILSKFDTFDSEESQSRAVELIVNGSPSGVPMLSPHAVVCRPKGAPYSRASELDTLKDLPASRSGVGALKARLPALLSARIKTNLPGLRAQIEQGLEVHQGTLSRIGDSPPDARLVLAKLQRKLRVSAARSMETDLSGPMETFKKQLRDSQKMLTLEWVKENFKHNAFHCPFFQGAQRFEELMDLICDAWEPLVHTLKRGVTSILRQAFVSDLPREPGIIGQKLKQTIRSSWAKHQEICLARLEEALKQALDQEREFKTMNNDITDKYQENLTFPDRLVDSIVQSVKAQHDETTALRRNSNNAQLRAVGWPTSTGQEKLRADIKQHVEEYFSEYGTATFREQTQIRVHAAINATWSVAHKNLCDNALAAVRTHVLNGVEQWIDKLVQDPTIKACAIEDDSVVVERSQALKGSEVLGRCLEDLQSVEG